MRGTVDWDWQNEAWYRLAPKQGRSGGWNVSPWPSVPPPRATLRTFELSLHEADLGGILGATLLHHGCSVDHASYLQPRCDVTASWPDGRRFGIEIKDEDPLTNAKKGRPETPAQQLVRYIEEKRHHTRTWALAAPGFSAELFAVLRQQPRLQGARLIAVRTFEHESGLGLLLTTTAVDAPPVEDGDAWPLPTLRRREGPTSRRRNEWLRALHEQMASSPTAVAAWGSPRLETTNNLSGGRAAYRGVAIEESRGAAQLAIEVRGRRRPLRRILTTRLEPTWHGDEPGFRRECTLTMRPVGNRSWWLKPLRAPEDSNDEKTALRLDDRIKAALADERCRARYGGQSFFIRYRVVLEPALRELPAAPDSETLARLRDFQVQAEQQLSAALRVIEG